METRIITMPIKRLEKPKQINRWRVYSRASLLLLAAMITARFVLLMIDVLQAQVEAPGAVAIPAYAGLLVFTGWKLREWTAEKRRNHESESKI